VTRRSSRFLLGATAFSTTSLLLSACGGPSADAYAHEACLRVHASILLFDKSQNASAAAKRAALAAQALSTLRNALQPAALAGGGGGQWEALEITLSESNRVAEATLIPALTAQCAATLQSS